MAAPSFRSVGPLVLILTICLPSAGAQAGWRDLLKIFPTGPEAQDPAATAAALTDGEVIEGLKQALSRGTETAVQMLGQKDGFLANTAVRIPMPESLRGMEKTLRGLGQDRIADEFIETMNRAAEQAVPEAAAIFSDSIRSMTIADAREILTGPDDAATRYFRSTGGERLRERFSPIVRHATDSVGVTAAYKNLVGKLGFASALVDTGALDLDAYVTDRALDGLFLMIAAEERKIRADPVARTTDLLKKVFGNAGG